MPVLSSQIPLFRKLYQYTKHGMVSQLVVRAKSIAIHIPQVKEVKAKKVSESKRDPDLVTVAVDLNVKMLAVVTVRHRERIIQTRFVRDRGLDQHRYRHLKRISKRQWQSDRHVKGEHHCRHLWDHIRRTNRNVAYTVARVIAEICAQYPGCVLIFERLRVMKGGKGSTSHRLNRKLANQIRGMIRDLTKEKAFASCSTVTVETNAHGTSQYCSRCGEKGERFSLKAGQRIVHKGGKLFQCKHCGLEGIHADWNASVNVHHSFYHEFHWKLRPKRSA
jgi:putative transposase